MRLCEFPSHRQRHCSDRACFMVSIFRKWPVENAVTCALQRANQTLILLAIQIDEDEVHGLKSGVRAVVHDTIYMSEIPDVTPFLRVGDLRSTSSQGLERALCP